MTIVISVSGQHIPSTARPASESLAVAIAAAMGPPLPLTAWNEPGWSAWRAFQIYFERFRMMFTKRVPLIGCSATTLPS